MTEQWSSIKLLGPDAITYANGQLSNNVQPGERFALLNPDSTVVTAGEFGIGDDAVILTVPRNDVESSVARLQRFKLRSKFDIVVTDEVIPLYQDIQYRIEDVWPASDEFKSSCTPHTFGKRFVERVIDFEKGCYTGQELVGRLDARGGNTPWRLVKATGNLDEIEEMVSQGPDGPKGITSRYETGTQTVCLAIVHRTVTVTDGLTVFWL